MIISSTKRRKKNANLEFYLNFEFSKRKLNNPPYKTPFVANLHEVVWVKYGGEMKAAEDLVKYVSLYTEIAYETRIIN